MLPAAEVEVVAANISSHRTSPGANVAAPVVIVIGKEVFVAVIVTEAEAWRPSSWAKVVALALALNKIAVNVQTWSAEVTAVSRAAATATVKVPALRVSPSVFSGTNVVGSEGTNAQPIPAAVPTTFKVPAVATASGLK